MFPEFFKKRSVVFEAAETRFGSSGLVGRNFLFPEFSFKRSVVFKAAKTGFGSSKLENRMNLLIIRLISADLNRIR